VRAVRDGLRLLSRLSHRVSAEDLRIRIKSAITSSEPCAIACSARPDNRLRPDMGNLHAGHIQLMRLAKAAGARPAPW